MFSSSSFLLSAQIWLCTETDCVNIWKMSGKTFNVCVFMFPTFSKVFFYVLLKCFRWCHWLWLFFHLVFVCLFFNTEYFMISKMFQVCSANSCKQTLHVEKSHIFMLPFKQSVNCQILLKFFKIFNFLQSLFIMEVKKKSSHTSAVVWKWCLGFGSVCLAVTGLLTNCRIGTNLIDYN